ncbi:hypothetical protein NDU88_005911 [Pleurodeles waltl]|uniref:Uncharacterized protein n=1 Tax=Pleurodeles waltl TaxID=8319 RepID=A0AAV7PGS3_PLEWA|nr:hypothetical protein NDU88_005911 [Pleurodeles waltl]
MKNHKKKGKHRCCAKERVTWSAYEGSLGGDDLRTTSPSLLFRWRLGKQEDKARFRVLYQRLLQTQVIPSDQCLFTYSPPGCVHFKRACFNLRPHFIRVHVYKADSFEENLRHLPVIFKYCAAIASPLCPPSLL